MANNLQSVNKPLQNIPENLKNRKWVIENIDWCIAMSPIYRRNKEQQLYDRYNGLRDANRFNHITKTYGIEFPAGKLKHIPLVRPLINAVAGEQQERPFGNIIRADDTDAIDAKREKIGQSLINEVVDIIRNPDADPDAELDAAEKEYHTFQMDFEVAASHVLKNYFNNHHTEQDLNEAFTDKMITGKQYYYCRVNRIGEDPEFKVIKPGSLFYSDENVKWVKECDWAVHPVRMTSTEILDRWGEKMSPEEWKAVEGYTSQFSADTYKMLNERELDAILERDAENPWSESSNYFEKLIVHFVEFKSIRKVYFNRSTNKYVPDAPFIKTIKDDKLHEFKEKYPGKDLEVRYVQDLYQGVRIGDNIFVDLGKVRYPRRNKLQPSKVYLSFNGLTFNGRIKPFSFVEKTEDIQDQYDILHYHKENLIAMSGSKGSYMDISQLPDFGGINKFEERLKKWLYYKKLGTAFIDRSRRGADNSYNQFGPYNDTLDASLMVVIEAIRHLEDTAGRIVGVNRQRMGAVSQYDGKSNTQTAIQQSNLVTEPFFNEHDEFARQACEDIVNSCKVAYKDGFTGAYVTSQRGQTIFSTEPEFSMHNYGLYMTNRISDDRSIEELKMAAYEMIKVGKMEWEDMFPLFRKTNLIDIEQTIRENVDKRQRQISQQQQQMMQLEQQLTIAREQIEQQEIKAKIDKLQSEVLLNQAKVQLEQEALSIQDKNETQKAFNDARRVDLEQEQIRAATQQNAQKSMEVKDK